MTAPSDVKNNRILVIDDNPAIHADIRKILHAHAAGNSDLELAKELLFGEPATACDGIEFTIDSAFQGQEGLAMVEKAAQAGAPYAVAFVDIRMPPGWDGIETTRQLWTNHPELQVVICTAYSDYSWAEMIGRLGQSPNLVVLKKPFDNIEVLQLAHAMRNKWELNRRVLLQLKDLDTLVRRRTAELETTNVQLKREVAARAEAESILRISEERFVRAFNASPIPLAIQRVEDGAFVDGNKAFLRMLSARREDVIGRSPAALQLWGDAPVSTLICDSLSQRLSVSNHRCQLRSLDGSLLEVLVSAELFDSGSGPHCLTIIQDITDQLKLEEQLRQSQKMEAIGQLAAGVAHDFNNILTAIHGHTSLLQSHLANQPNCSRSLTVISLAAERAARLVRQLLAFSRKQVLKPQLLQIDHVAAGLAELLRRTLGSHIQLELRAEGDIAPVEADLSMMEQIIINLCVNARDAMPTGGKVSIRTRTVQVASAIAANRDELKPGCYVCISVTDSGCGIPSENLGRIFDPFFTTKEIGKGTGLGLATVYGIVKQHSGCIDVESVVNRGTTFHVFLPASKNISAPAEAPSPAAVDARRGSECVLVVEDEEAVRTVAKAFLTTNGYRVIEASSGPEALKLFQDRQNEVDLLFTDIMMPGNMLGYDLAKLILELKPGLPVLFTSGYSPELSKFESQPGTAFLGKPFTPDQLLDLVRRCLDS